MLSKQAILFILIVELYSKIPKQLISKDFSCYTSFHFEQLGILFLIKGSHDHKKHWPNFSEVSWRRPFKMITSFSSLTSHKGQNNRIKLMAKVPLPRKRPSRQSIPPYPLPVQTPQKNQPKRKINALRCQHLQLIYIRYKERAFSKERFKKWINNPNILQGGMNRESFYILKRTSEPPAINEVLCAQIR